MGPARDLSSAHSPARPRVFGRAGQCCGAREAITHVPPVVRHRPCPHHTRKQVRDTAARHAQQGRPAHQQGARPEDREDASRWRWADSSRREPGQRAGHEQSPRASEQLGAQAPRGTPSGHQPHQPRSRQRQGSAAGPLCDRKPGQTSSRRRSLPGSRSPSPAHGQLAPPLCTEVRQDIMVEGTEEESTQGPSEAAREGGREGARDKTTGGHGPAPSLSPPAVQLLPWVSVPSGPIHPQLRCCPGPPLNLAAWGLCFTCGLWGRPGPAAALPPGGWSCGRVPHERKRPGQEATPEAVSKSPQLWFGGALGLSFPWAKRTIGQPVGRPATR